MKGQADRTKVVVRNLPPTIPEAAFVEQIEGRFGGRYGWLSFRPPKIRQKDQLNARAYIDFNKPEDVVEFAEFFNGHVFVNEKGNQFKATVEYAPCQRVPKQWSKKDGREGTIVKDPDYLEFLQAISKPVENLPSAEVQLDRRDAERAGAAKDALIVTPLMDFIRQKRAKIESRRIISNGKPIRKVTGVFGSPSSSASLRRGSENRRVSAKMYVQRDSAKNASGKNKSTYNMVSKRDDQSDKPVAADAASPIGASEGRTGTPGSVDTGKKILLLKGKEKEISLVSGGLPLQQSDISKSAISSSAFKQNQRRESSGRIIKSILLNKDNQQQVESSKLEREKRPPRLPNYKPFVKDANGLVAEERSFKNDMHDFPKDNRQERRTRNKDRPDRGVWAPLRRSDGSHASDESLSSYNSQGSLGEMKSDLPFVKAVEVKSIRVEQDPQKYGGRKVLSHDGKESDGSFTVLEGKPLKRGGPNYCSNEKQVWVQKPSAGP